MRLIVYTGKGGTGKTVTSCATAIGLSEMGYKTLLISADPAHTISDALCIDIGHNTKEINSNLDAIEIDPLVEISKDYVEIISSISSSFISKGVDSSIAYEIAMLPGMTQLFSLIKIEEVIRKNDYEQIVLDMPASGEALKFLYFPKLMGSMGRHISGLTSMLSGFAKMFQPMSNYSAYLDSFITQTDIIKRLDNLFNILSNQTITSLRLVTNLNNFSVKNAKRALMSANLFGINVDLVIINKVDVHDEDKRKFLENTKFNFFPLPCREAIRMKEELQGIEMLKQHNYHIFGTDDPSSIFFNEKVYSIEENRDSITLVLKIPFAKNAILDIQKKSDELMITLEHDRGILANIIILPFAAVTMNLVSSKIINNQLVILLKR
ncbi:MAG TPA: TRC40/GET3/ArsA family transport-energizing ATPase [Nitrososphaeraceae archaeon]|nr:TRC40/GET3/ArsA family transport-energizing ATPase [Nitrososphaeraceae archaeon]